jgi:hypothetical protein
MAIIKTLKWGTYSTNNKEVEMNIIENRSDLNKFIKETNSTLMKDLWSDYIKNKSIILVHANNVSWCTENTTTENHPSSFNRVKLGELIK